jgi:hypothetical protein
LPEHETGAVFFSSVIDTNVVALTGSAQHLIGASGDSKLFVGSSVYGVLHAISYLAEGFPKDDLGLPTEWVEAAARVTSMGPGVESRMGDRSLDAICWAAVEIPGPVQPLEFLAKPLLRGTARYPENQSVLLATPVYVALAD